MKNLVLQIKELKVHFNTDDGPIKAVDGISFDVKKNSVVAIVGETVADQVSRFFRQGARPLGA